MGGIDPKYPFASPGFVDIQVNGFEGVDFSDPKLTAERAAGVLQAIWKTGVTRFCATLVTSTIENL
jgi:N-acetylglucosamine-6-phosphate deacetylase